MNCNKCQSELPASAKFCAHCGQPVEGRTSTGEAASLAMAAGAEPSLASPAPAPLVSIVNGAVQIAPAQEAAVPVPEAPTEAEVQAMDVMELEAFQLDAIDIPPPPPPPPVLQKSSRVQSFDPLPTLTGSAEQDESAKPRPTKSDAATKPADLEPKPPTDDELDDLLAEVTIAVQQSQTKAADKPPPAPPAPSVPPPPLPASAPFAAVAVPVAAAPNPATAPTVIVRKPAIPLPPREEEELGPQPEDVPDEDAIRRKQALRKLIMAGLGLILIVAAGLYVLGGGLRSKPVKPPLSEPAKPVQLEPETAAPAEPPAAVPVGVESAPEAEPDLAPVAAPQPQQAPPVAKPTPKSVAKPANKRSEEDAYLRQIRRQLEQR